MNNSRNSSVFSNQPSNNPLASFGGEGFVDERNIRAIEAYDKRLLAWLSKMYVMLNKDRMDPNEVLDSLQMLERMKAGADKAYIKNLVYPEDATDAKIPTVFPVPSSSFKLHSSFLVSTNATGNVAGYVNPLFLGNGALSTFYINNNAGLTGSALSNFFTTVAANQNIPVNIYQRYRLVSYSLQVTYIGRWDIVSGVIGCGVTFDSGIGAAQAVGFIELNGARYGNFDLVDDSYYSYRTTAINGVRVLYIPVDPKYEEYVSTNTVFQGEQLHFYAQGLPPSVASLRVDTFANFECLADAEFQNYIPQTTCSPAPDQIKIGTKLLTENARLVADSLQNASSKKDSVLGSIFGGVKDFYSGLLNVSKTLAGSVLPIAADFIPGGKTLSALVRGGGSLVNSLMDNSTLASSALDNSMVGIGERYI